VVRLPASGAMLLVLLLVRCKSRSGDSEKQSKNGCAP
jgi:hypothetical protein